MTAALIPVDQVEDDETKKFRELYLGIIEAGMDAHPRSLQRRIGPSEIGIDCDRCLGHKLAQTPQTPRGPAWKPAIGTAMHAQLEEWFAHFSGTAEARGIAFQCEERVSVGEINGVEITGSCDLYLPELGLVADHKVVGRRMLDGYCLHGPSRQYRVQAHLYARGFARRGSLAKRVAICFLPRDGELGDTHIWSEPYDESIAVDALAHASEIAATIDALKQVDHDAAMAYINGLPRAERCFSCPSYPHD